MKTEEFHSVYFIGIGGIGMSALARYFRACGASVSGYDRSPSRLTDALQREGINVYFDEDPNHIPSDTALVVYTPAIPSNHKELVYAGTRNIPLLKRAELLGRITSGKFCIAVAGTHGKTSITCMITHILRLAGIPVVSFIGGVSVNYKSNLILDKGAEIIVVEADEYDRSFLKLHPDIAVVSSVDPDHLDIYGDYKSLQEAFNSFVSGIKTGGTAIVRKNTPVNPPQGLRHISYGSEAAALARIENVRVEDGVFVFDIYTGEVRIENIRAGVPGLHNAENALAAALVCSCAGVGPEDIKKGIGTYEGVQRRFDIRVKRNGYVYVDDYAHHPEEIRKCIETARTLWPEKKLTGIFQPHLFSRTRDLAGDFAHSLGLLDEVWLLDIYPAREEPIPGVNAEMLLERVGLKEKKLLTKDQVLREAKNMPPGVLLTMGAGDIDQLVAPLENCVGFKKR